MKLKEIADLIGGRIIGNPEIEITGVSGIREARHGDITFLADKKNIKDIYNTNASAVIVRDEIEGLSTSMLIVNNPHLAFAKALEVFYTKPFKSLGISNKAIIGDNVDFGDNVTVYPLVYISSNITIGARVTIFPGVYIGDRVSIGEDSIIYPNVTIRENVTIGKRVIIHSGTVIGSDGFGYVLEKGKHYKIPQVGGVIIEDDVEIGANVTIDRATTGNTIVGSGTKIDNLVQIAHNVKIGKNCIIVAQVGIGGSVEIGDGVILAGQVGVRDHVKIGSGVKIGAQSGIVHDIPDNEAFSGTPAIPHKTWLRAQSIYAKLPEYIKRLQELEKKAK
jgi:UDP-3-O-[3-hydroxymyristoyl] glucosamine N-acyltransferase